MDKVYEDFNISIYHIQMLKKFVTLKLLTVRNKMILIENSEDFNEIKKTFNML